MNIYLKSDLHLDLYKDRQSQKYFWEKIIPEKGVLILAGDTAQVDWNKWNEFVDFLDTRKELYIIFILGNHEYYNNQNMTMDKTLIFFRELLKPFNDHIRLLQCESWTINNVTFLGCTLWSDVTNPLSFKLIRDYEMIPEMNQRLYKQLFENDKKWLQNELKDQVKPCFIITHHAPLLHGTSHPQYQNKPSQCMFASELIEFIKIYVPKHSVWCFGHTHYNCFFNCFDRSIWSNPLGYKTDLMNSVVVPSCLSSETISSVSDDEFFNDI